MNVGMSAIGTKRTKQPPQRLSAFGQQRTKSDFCPKDGLSANPKRHSNYADECRFEGKSGLNAIKNECDR